MRPADRARELGDGEPVHLSGGDTAWVYRVGDVVVKVLPDAPTGFFAAEARGLVGLATAGIAVPAVRGVHDDAIVLDYHPPGPPDWPALARALAHLHSVEAPLYGSHEPVWLGQFRFAGGTHSDPVRCLVDLRLRPLFDATRSTLGRERAERVGRFLDALSFETEGPCVVHGDLWSGNVLHADVGPLLIDPSTQGAERAYDLAMMRLFGGFPPEFWSEYESHHPIPEGVSEAIPAHQLVFVLVHVAMFGQGYNGAVDRITG